jgi:hypothetical protein
MLEAAIRQQPEKLPFAWFLTRKDCLFKQMRTLNLSPAPTMIAKYLRHDFRDLRPLVEEITKAQNGDTSKFLHMVAISDPEAFPKIQGVIHPDSKKLRGTTVPSFVVAGPDKKKCIKDNQFFKWPLEHPFFTVSDAELVTVFYNRLWTGQTALEDEGGPLNSPPPRLAI